MRGAKWMNEARHLTDADREKIRGEVSQARNEGLRSVGVRPTEVGNTLCAITFGPGGGSLWGFVRKH